jgi:hypothetical protein
MPFAFFLFEIGEIVNKKKKKKKAKSRARVAAYDERLQQVRIAGFCKARTTIKHRTNNERERERATVLLVHYRRVLFDVATVHRRCTQAKRKPYESGTIVIPPGRRQQRPPSLLLDGLWYSH